MRFLRLESFQFWGTREHRGLCRHDEFGRREWLRRLRRLNGRGRREGWKPSEPARLVPTRAGARLAAVQVALAAAPVTAVARMQGLAVRSARLERRVWAERMARAATLFTGPCDIYQSGNTPCVAAHSTVRALYGSYGGNLYQVRRASDRTTKDVGLLAPGGFANSATQDTFCAGTTCTISAIYDQSPRGNHLHVTPPGGWLPNGGKEANATAAKINISGHPVYGVYVVGTGFVSGAAGVGYRDNTTSGVATGDQPEAMYMVASGKHYNQWCCFDYGNAETNNMNNGPATMEAVYFGNSTQWGRGSGTGPWVMADLEEGVFAGQSFDPPPTNTPLIADYVTAMLKGRPGGFALKGGSAQSGTLKTMYDGRRPNGYDPMKKEGAIILGVGGDNSPTGDGTFFEGCMTSGYPTDAIDDAVQANIVAAGYGR